MKKIEKEGKIGFIWESEDREMKERAELAFRNVNGLRIVFSNLVKTLAIAELEEMEAWEHIRNMIKKIAPGVELRKISWSYHDQEFITSEIPVGNSTSSIKKKSK